MRRSRDGGDAGYEKFKRKIFLQSAGLMGLSILIIGAVYLFVWRGNVADWLVSFFQTVFGMGRLEATRLYANVFRSNSDVISLCAVAATFIVLTRVSLKRFTGYFDSINKGINALIENDGSHIALTPEMEAIEEKLNTVRHTLEQRARDAQLAEQRKNELVMYLAHDLRTPLTSVIGYLSLLNETADIQTEQRGQFVRVALEKAYRLDHLIDELFEITRLNSQAMSLTKTTVDLSYLLVQLADELYPQLAANGQQAVIHAPEDLSVPGDPDKLARVFSNILKNAAAYGEACSTIHITAGLSGDRVSVVFKNAGSIPQDKLAAVFEKFYRLDAARSSNTGGTGLGLAIAQEIVAGHGGRIVAESDDCSTTFTVELPASPGQAGRGGPAAAGAPS